MQPVFIFGLIIFLGFVLGELCVKFRLPKVTGYIVAGILLNPKIVNLVPGSFVESTDVIIDISLSFITFSVGGTLSITKLRALGKKILSITIFESEFAFLSVLIIFILLGPSLIHSPNATMSLFYIPLALLLAPLASPTDPSATLAVEHEYHAKGDVTSTVMGVAAMDDVLGIINYSIAIALASLFIANKPIGFNSILHPIIIIFGSVILGGVFGFFLNLSTKIFKRETEGGLIVIILAVLSLCFGVAKLLNFDPLLTIMTMGFVVVNFNPKHELIFKMLERYTEELIFVLFFTISAMHLDFSVLVSNYMLIIVFVIFRALGKVSGVFVGASISKSSAKVKKYTAGGLIPQGGIVIGLALVVSQNPAFNSISSIVINVILGATIIHEIIGPVISKYSLNKAGELTIEE